MVSPRHLAVPPGVQKRHPAGVLHFAMAGQLPAGAARQVDNRDPRPRQARAVHGRRDNLCSGQESPAQRRRSDPQTAGAAVPLEAEEEPAGLQVLLSGQAESDGPTAGFYGLRILPGQDHHPQEDHAQGHTDGPAPPQSERGRAQLLPPQHRSHAELHGLVFLHRHLRVLQAQDQAVRESRQAKENHLKIRSEEKEP